MHTMEFLSQWTMAGPYICCFALSIVSALVPWVNGEVILLSIVTLAHSPCGTAVLVLLASAGQMAGKCILYWAGKGIIPIKSARMKETMSTWKGRLEQSPSKTLSLVFVSSAVGIPPFYVITILAGALHVRFGPFFAVGACGRLLRFSVLAFVPWIMLR
jgi:membrane protein YqaA with SNARE-associated domain